MSVVEQRFELQWSSNLCSVNNILSVVRKKNPTFFFSVNLEIWQSCFSQLFGNQGLFQMHDRSMYLQHVSLWCCCLMDGILKQKGLQRMHFL